MINKVVHSQKRILLGIDPGLTTTGFSIIEGIGNKYNIKECGYISYEKTKTIPKKIAQFYDFLNKKIDLFNINEIAIETPFFSKNSATFVKLGYLRSIIYLACEQRSITLHEFAPRSIKQAITGYGNAEKEQVKRAITMLFPQLTQFDIQKYDVTDAIGIALCGLWSKN